MSRLTIEAVDDVAGLEALRVVWDDLHAVCPAPSLFTTHLWLSAWWRHLAAGQRLRVLVLREGTTVRGIVPLCLRRVGPSGLNVWKLEFLGTGQSDRMDFLIRDPDDALWEQVVDHLIAGHPRWTLLDLRQVPEQSPQRVGLERALAARGYAVRVQEDEHCPAIRLTGTWEQYLEAQFSGKSRWQLRKKSKAAAARGEVRIRYVTDPHALPAALDAATRLEASDAYGGRPRIGIFDRPAARAFYLAVAPTLAERQWMHLSLMEIGDHLVAYRYGFRHGNRHYDYYHDYDPAYADASPGMVLMMDLVERCFQEGVQVFDLLRGAEAYKSQWATQVDRCVRIMAFAPTLRGRLADKVYAARRPPPAATATLA